MERLSSCYFCGDAVDAAIEEYPLVDSGRYDAIDTDQRIVLCPSCRQKLTTVIERVLEAALEGESEPAITAAEEDLLADVQGDEEMTVTDVEPLDDDGGDSEGSTVVDEAPSVPHSAVADDGTDERASDDDDSGESAEGAPESDGPGSTGEDTEPAVPRATDADATSEDGSDEGETESETEGDEDPASAEAVVEREVGYEKAEFNKVVRLLQNREFPVAIDELTTVAGSAYRIDEETTHAIIDALIERGIVADEGDELVRA